jgi:hypothetical protein
MFILLLQALLALADDEEKLKFSFFEKLDKNKDGLLTHDQFIDGLHRAFLTAGIENSKLQVNNFGREFLGEKDSEGKVDLNDILKWIESRELEHAFEEWKHIDEEGEEHHKEKHQHQRKKFKMPRNTLFRGKKKNDL